MIELTDDTYAEALAASDRPVLLYFTATFCGPSAWFHPLIAQLELDYDQIAIAPIDVEDCPRLGRAMQIKGTPTLTIVRKGEPIASRIGTMTYRELREFVDTGIEKAAHAPV